MKKMIILLLSLFVVISSVSFADIDTNKLDKGIVGVSYSDASTNVYRVLVQRVGDSKKNRLSYPFFANGKTEYFPLQLGNGDYKVSLMRRTSGKKYAFVETKTVTVSLADQNVIYLNSIQNINWSYEDDAIKYALNQTKDAAAAEAALDIFYDYLTTNVVYDYDKAASVQSDYVPSITKTFVDSKGICYDYSALLASFMRSKGFPTRLVKGYTTNVNGYHAWNEVLIGDTWMVVDTTVDAGRKLDVKFKPSEEYQKVHEY